MEPPAAPGPERLFDSHRFPSDGFLLLALLLYAPVGLCLLVLRLFIGVHVFLVSCALPDSVLRRFIVRVMCSVLGLCVQQSDPRLRDAGVRVYIANHVTQFDHNIINLLTSCNTPALNSAPGFICWSRGFMELGVSGSRAELVDSLKAYSSHRGNPPLLLFPEEAATNGRAGLLHFSSWPFSVSDVVQPVALQVLRPLVTVHLSPGCGIDQDWGLSWTHRTDGLENTFMLSPAITPGLPRPPLNHVSSLRLLPLVRSLVPWEQRPASIQMEPCPSPVLWMQPHCALFPRVWLTPPGLQSCSGPSLSPSQYIKWLPSVPRRMEEPSEDFALRVQELLAMELGVVSTRLTAADKTEHMKRLRHTSLLPFAPASSQALAARRRVPSGLAGAPEDRRIAAMVQQVKEVLPHVPLEVIRIDLAQTNCVDTTIANLLEGRVSFFPDSREAGTDLSAPATSQAPAASGILGSSAEPSSKAAAKQFARSPVERHLSLQERKRALYDYARR
ncbi:lipid droplet-regulating VLDL assembly factor AUP1 isoform 2-T2 [Amazona ochrocephala]